MIEHESLVIESFKDEIVSQYIKKNFVEILNKQFNKDMMHQLNLPEEPIGVAARTQLMLKQFADTLPSESFRTFIDQL